jgi:hypothetical protein
LKLLEGVPMGCRAMLVCNVKIVNEAVVRTYPLRPPIAPGSTKILKTKDASIVLPVFLIHFS